MERFSRPVRLAIAFLLIGVFAWVGTAAVGLVGASPGGVKDTDIRSRLLGQKGQPQKDEFTPRESSLYSGLIYDFEVTGPLTMGVPYVERLVAEPHGGYEFAWLVLVKHPTEFWLISEGQAGDFSLRVDAGSGLPEYKASPGLTLPAEVITLDPGIHAFKLRSAARPVNLRFSFDPDLSMPPMDVTSMKTLNLQMGSRALKDLERMVNLALESGADEVIKMPTGRVEAELLDEFGGRVAGVQAGLSGRTKEHLAGFPSLDLKLEGGLTYGGMRGFKLYKPRNKNGVFDFVFLSVLNDMGFIVPRQDMVLLKVNGRRIGIFYLLETMSASTLVNQRRLDGGVVGVDGERMFFSYPYGGELSRDYFFEPSGNPSFKKIGNREFLSSDFVRRLDEASTARYLGFSANYLMTHGLGVDDLRFYEDPVTGRYEPIPRDINPGMANNIKDLRSYIIHMYWSFHQPNYTIWPITFLRKGSYAFDPGVPYRTILPDQPTVAILTDMHFALSGFLGDTANYGLALGYLSKYAEDDATMALIQQRTINTLREIFRTEPNDTELNSQYVLMASMGPYFHGELIKQNLYDRPIYVTDGGETYRWNLRTAMSLDPSLGLSYTAAKAYEGNEDISARMQALNFMLDKRIDGILRAKGLHLRPSFAGAAPSGDALLIDASESSLRMLSRITKRTDNEPIRSDVVVSLGTHAIDAGTAAVMFLVRNATERGEGYALEVRDSMKTHAPIISERFRLTSAPADGYNADYVSIVTNSLHPGEDYRLLVFSVALEKEPIFYKLRVPEGGWYTTPYVMYLPAKATPEARAQAEYMPGGMVKAGKAWQVPAGTSVHVNQDLMVEGNLVVSEGASLLMGPGVSIYVKGDLFILGSPGRRVRVAAASGQPWGGLLVEGGRGGEVGVLVQYADIEGYGEFPRTRVGTPGGDRRLSGGITFSQARVQMEDVFIAHAHGEDALNLIHSHAVLKGLRIEGAYGDAVDMDFTDAYVEGIGVSGGGGDGLDVSGALVVVQGGEFRNNADKGISAGEQSNVFVRGSLFEGNDMGIADKDQSSLDVADSVFRNNRIGVARFIKKPYFGEPSFVERDNEYAGNTEDGAWLGLFQY